MDFPWDAIVSGINAAYNNARSDLRRGLLPEAPEIPRSVATDSLMFLDNINRYFPSERFRDSFRQLSLFR